MRIRNLFDPGSGMEKYGMEKYGSGMEKYGFGINIPDPQHWSVHEQQWQKGKNYISYVDT
jgi:hypothetical protein